MVTTRPPKTIVKPTALAIRSRLETTKNRELTGNMGTKLIPERQNPSWSAFELE